LHNLVIFCSCYDACMFSIEAQLLFTLLRPKKLSYILRVLKGFNYLEAWNFMYVCVCMCVLNQICVLVIYKKKLIPHTDSNELDNRIGNIFIENLISELIVFYLLCYLGWPFYLFVIRCLCMSPSILFQNNFIFR